MALTRQLALPLEHLVLIVFLFLGYYSPRPLRFVYACIMAGTFVGIAWWLPREQAAHDYAFGVLGAGWIYRGFQLLVIESDIYRDFKWIGHGEKSKSDSDLTASEPVLSYADLSFWQKWNWCITHCFSARGIGLNWTIPHVPKAPARGTTVGSYLWSQTIHLAWYYFLQDIGRTYLATQPFVQTDGALGTPVRELWGWERFKMVGSLGLMTFMQNDLPYTVACIIGVATGLFFANPEFNAPVFGRWREAYTLRRFWGRVWHQHIRKPMQVIGQWVARDIFRARKGSLLSSYTQVYVSFILSGGFHVAASYSIYQTLGRSWFWTWLFFIAQANGIVVEDFVQWAGRKAGIKESRWTHMLGGVWVVCWFWWTAAWFFDDSICGGWVRPETFPVSVIRGLWKGEWETIMV